MSKNLYQEDDINDLVAEDMDHEETFYKGRGPDLKPRKQRGSLQHIADQDAADESRNAARARVNAVVAARTAKMTDSQRAKMRKSDDEMDINDLVAEDAKIRENDMKIADHPVKTSKNSPTGG